MANILCVDDDEDGLMSRKDVLQSDGHRVWGAHLATEGLQIFQAEKIDLVIVDYYLTDTTGLMVAEEIKQINPEVPIIVLSGFGQLPGEAVGVAHRWILKGSGPKILLDAVNALTSSVKQERRTETDA